MSPLSYRTVWQEIDLVLEGCSFLPIPGQFKLHQHVRGGAKSRRNENTNVICMFLGKNGECRTECSKVRRHFLLVELFRQYVDTVLVGGTQFVHSTICRHNRDVPTVKSK